MHKNLQGWVDVEVRLTGQDRSVERLGTSDATERQEKDQVPLQIELKHGSITVLRK